MGLHNNNRGQINDVKWERNQKQMLELVRWLDKPEKKILTLRNFLIRLQQGLLSDAAYFFCYSTPYIKALLRLLQQYNLVSTFYTFQHAAGGVLDLPILYIVLPGLGGTPCRIRVYNRNKRFYYLSYKQVNYLYARSKNIYVFNTPFGLLRHEELLKKKIGGHLLCRLV